MRLFYLVLAGFVCWIGLTSNLFPFLHREHSREVDPGGQTLLSQRSHHPGGQQERSAKRRTHAPRAGQDEAGTFSSNLGQMTILTDSPLFFVESY